VVEEGGVFDRRLKISILRGKSRGSETEEDPGKAVTRLRKRPLGGDNKTREPKIGYFRTSVMGVIRRQTLAGAAVEKRVGIALNAEARLTQDDPKGMQRDARRSGILRKIRKLAREVMEHIESL